MRISNENETICLNYLDKAVQTACNRGNIQFTVHETK